MLKIRRRLFIFAYLLPAVFLYGLFVIVPLLQAFPLSMYRWRGISPKKSFIGIENYQRLVEDESFRQAFRNTLWILVVAGISLIVLGLILSHAMQSKTRSSSFVRGIYLIPHVISMVVVAIIWQFIYNPSFGILNKVLSPFGVEEGFAWLGNPKTALPAVTAAFVWYALGFYIMIFSAGLQNIPAEISEAAELDGARGLKKFRSITWPMLWSIRKVAMIYVVINVLNIFALVKLMTDGGPSGHTEVLISSIYREAFVNTQAGYATSMAVVNFCVAMVLAMALLFIFRKNPESSK